MTILYFIAGLFLLLQGAKYLVDGSTAIARHLGVSSLVIGLTVIAFGTSAPELIVNILAAYQNHSELVLANVNGSNIINILLITGLIATFVTIPVKRRLITREIPFMILSSLIVFLLLVNGLFFGGNIDITWIEGIILLILFLFFVYYLLREAKTVDTQAIHEKPLVRPWHAGTMVVMGAAGLAIGAELLVRGAVDIATMFGVSKSLIGLTVVALGTSLPELAASIVAARKQQVDLALGNVIGSNIFNALAVLGAASVVSGNVIIGDMKSLIDAGVVLGASILLLLLLLLKNYRKKSWHLSRGEGIFMLLTYAAYIAYIVIRG